MVAAPAPAQVSHTSADYGGYATGTVLHADALEGGLGEEVLRLADAEVSMSGASVASKGFTGAIKNEEFPSVIDPSKAAEPAELLVVGGQSGHYPGNCVLDLDTALRAARAFYVSGRFEGAVTWIRSYGVGDPTGE